MFGYAVAIRDPWLAVSSAETTAPDVGYVGVVDMFHHEGDAWVYAGAVQSPHPDDPERFGRAVALDEGVLLVGAPYANGAGSGAEHAGLVYVYALQ